MKDYWATDSATNFTFFRPIFSWKRFFQIFGMLHVSDINSNTKRAKIQPFFLDILSPAFQSSYTPHKAIAEDESMITFKGRISFHQYLKGKPHPCWPRSQAFVLSDSLTGYMQSNCIYYGKETLLINTDHPHTT